MLAVARRSGKRPTRSVGLQYVVLTYRRFEEVLSELIRVLASQFEMQHTGPLRWILSMEVKNTKEGFNMHQGLYIEKILEKFNMSDCSLVLLGFVFTGKCGSHVIWTNGQLRGSGNADSGWGRRL